MVISALRDAGSLLRQKATSGLYSKHDTSLLGEGPLLRHEVRNLLMSGFDFRIRRLGRGSKSA